MMPSTRRPGHTASTILGIGWYRPEDWESLLQVISGCAKLQDTYAGWLADAEGVERDRAARGTPVRRVFVNPDELAGWCLIRGLVPDVKARASFVSDKIGRGIQQQR